MTLSPFPFYRPCLRNDTLLFYVDPRRSFLLFTVHTYYLYTTFHQFITYTTTHSNYIINTTKNTSIQSQTRILTSNSSFTKIKKSQEKIKKYSTTPTHILRSSHPSSDTHHHQFAHLTAHSSHLISIHLAPSPSLHLLSDYGSSSLSSQTS